MSHMDFNIATALHFASKGVGYLFNPNNLSKVKDLCLYNFCRKQKLNQAQRSY